MRLFAKLKIGRVDLVFFQKFQKILNLLCLYSKWIKQTGFKMQSTFVWWIIFGSYIFLGSLNAEAFVSANFLLFGPSVDAVTVERLEI